MIVIKNIYSSDARQLRIAAEAVNTVADDLAAEVRLLREKHLLLSQQWSGTDADQVVSGLSDDCDGLEEILNEIREFYEDLKAVCAENEKAESQLDELARTISI